MATEVRFSEDINELALTELSEAQDWYDKLIFHYNEATDVDDMIESIMLANNGNYRLALISVYKACNEKAS